MDAPDLAKRFFDDYGAVFAEGELTEREKALIALAVAHAVQCPYCIDAFTQSCLEKGSNMAEMTGAIHVVTAIRGGHLWFTEFRCGMFLRSCPCKGENVRGKK